MVTPQTPGVPDHAAEESPGVARDAKQRAWRTMLQGLLLDVLVAVALVVYEAMAVAEPDWRLLLLSLLKTGLMAAASYVMRVVRPPTE